MAHELAPQNLQESVISLSPKVSIFDRSNPRSLINIVWEELRDALNAIETNNPELLDLTERQFEKKISPDPTVCRLRLRFWDEYARAQDRGKRMFKEEICRNVCSGDYWVRHISKNLELIAYIIIPPAGYATTMEELLYKGLDRMREVLDLPFRDEKTNRVDTRLIAEVVKIVQILDQRVKGAIIQKVAIQQRIDQRTQHSIGAPDPLSQNSMGDLQSIESQLSSLNSRLERWQDKAVIEAAPEREVLVIPANVGGEVIDGRHGRSFVIATEGSEVPGTPSQAEET